MRQKRVDKAISVFVQFTHLVNKIPNGTGVSSSLLAVTALDGLCCKVGRLCPVGYCLGVGRVATGDFEGRHHRGEIILRAVRWYCRYGIGYRDLETMLAERGIEVDHTTIYHWVQRYAPEIENRLRWYRKRPSIARSGRVDETDMNVMGQWTYLYRAADKDGDLIDFTPSSTRSAKAAKRFPGKALQGLKAWQKPLKINTDKAPTYGIAIRELTAESKLPGATLHRQVTSLNNVVETDHGKLKRLIKPTLGFKSMKPAYATLKGFEVNACSAQGTGGDVAIWRCDHGGGAPDRAQLRHLHRIKSNSRSRNRVTDDLCNRAVGRLSANLRRTFPEMSGRLARNLIIYISVADA